MISTGRDAVLAAEGRISQAVCLSNRSPSPAPELDMAPEAPAAPNVFGQPHRPVHADSPSDVLASARGLCLSGERVSAWVSGGRLPEVANQLRVMAGSHLPLVIHSFNQALHRHARASGSDHAGYHCVADTGIFLAMARNVQEAVDLTLITRRASELSLIPGVVSQDGPETAFAAQDLSLPDDSFLREFLPAPGREIECPTPAQRMLFGDHRSAVPRWFSLERPCAFGVVQSGDDYAAGLAGQRVFFDEHFREFVEQSMKDYTGATGRSVSWVYEHQLRGAEYVMVVQGSAIEMAVGVADWFRKTHGLKVGVLGVTFLRPFPAEEIRRAVEGARVITICERVDSALGMEPPLTREIRSALGSHRPRILTATYGLGGQKLTSAQFIAAVGNMVDPEAGRERIHLGMIPPAETSSYPKRETLMQRVRRAYPNLDSQTLEMSPSPDLRAGGTFTVSFHAASHELPGDFLTRLSRAVSEIAGSRVRSRCGAHQTMLAGRIHASDSECPDPGDETPVDLALLSPRDWSGRLNPLMDVIPNGEVIVLTTMDPEVLWEEMPEDWRESIRERTLRLHLYAGGWGQLIEGSILQGHVKHEDIEDLRPFSWSDFPEAIEPAPESPPPQAIRRFAKWNPGFDNVPRFYGEVMQPRGEGSPSEPTFDPLLTLGHSPACSSTLHARSFPPGTLPEIRISDCTGCGLCWTTCPDSSIGPVALGTEPLMRFAADRLPADHAVVGKIGRAVRQLAGHIDKALSAGQASELTEELLSSSLDWLKGKLDIAEAERPDLEQFLQTMRDEVMRLSWGINQAYFHEPREEQKGGGELLALAVNPRTCQSCALCAAICPEEAIHLVPRTAGTTELRMAEWQSWEELPDTSGETIARLLGRERADPPVSPLAAILLSRHCLLALAGGDGAKPGSGSRIALRHILAVTEYQTQQNLSRQVQKLTDLSAQLRDRIRALMSEALSVEDPEALETAIAGLDQQSADVGGILLKLQQLGRPSRVDAAKVHRLADIAKRIDRELWELTDGPNGHGRARYAMVVASGPVGEWAMQFARNPLFAPVTFDSTGGGVARGVLEGLLARSADQFRLIRSAELALESPPDWNRQELALERLTWREFSGEEFFHSPPLFLLGEPGRPGDWQPYLNSDLPLKVILFHGFDELEETGAPFSNPALLAMAQHRAFVLSASIGHPEQLYEGIRDLLSSCGPGLVCVHTPSPRQHGFPTDEAVNQAVSAVAARVHPLFKYDPGRAGVFGTRLTLEGNPDPEEPATGQLETERGNLIQWALSERRFHRFFEPVDDADPAPQQVPLEQWLQLDADERQKHTPTVVDAADLIRAVKEPLVRAFETREQAWRILLEIAGVVTPFTALVRSQVEGELKREYETELEALKKAHEDAMDDLVRRQEEIQAARLKERLLQLSGYPRA